MTTSNDNEQKTDMWTLRAKNFIHVLRQVWPKSSDAERIKRGSLSTLARMERNKSCKKKSPLALSSYLDVTDMTLISRSEKKLVVESPVEFYFNK